MRHDETAIVPYLRGELGGAERREVEAHLAGCADCRAVADEFRSILAALVEAAPAPPAMHWGRYRAELRDKLDRQRRRAASPPRWRPVSLALSGALAAVLVFLAIEGTDRGTRSADLSAVEETVMGGRLDLFRQYSLVERLDLLEDLDVIGQLDALERTREG